MPLSCSSSDTRAAKGPQSSQKVRQPSTLMFSSRSISTIMLACRRSCLWSSMSMQMKRCTWSRAKCSGLDSTRTI
ncbi:hypothetical protein DPMN_189168 [Dreissena polymorpha]|uniref:Uncharacterized protein n=1 Tax=Dreissena polymorpha TaxID=45954 RepID=A0A9D4IC25_DREPO|nr:hypothetical protein DPMN_189168 [Dreissena polymorpha]